MPTTDRARSANPAAHKTTEEGRIAREIVRLLRPTSVLDISSSPHLQEELQSHGVVVYTPEDMGSEQTAGLITCIPSAGDIGLDLVDGIEQWGGPVLFLGSQENSAPLLSWLMSFAVAGFAPDTAFDSGSLGSNAVLLRRGPVWPPEALRLFAETMPLRDPVQRILELEMELARTRRAPLSPRELYGRDLAEAHYSGPVAGINPFLSASDEAAQQQTGQLSAVEDRVKALESQVFELCRSNESVHSNLNGMLQSRIWRTLTSVGNVLLRLTGRAA